MENSKQLAMRFREVLLNGKWIAQTNFQDQLSQTQWQDAKRKIGSLNSIAALSFHVNYYIAGLNEFFQTGTLSIRDKYSFDLPAITTEAEWLNLLSTLLQNAEQFAEHVEQMSMDQLGAVFVDEKYGTYRRNIEGMIEHAYYHLGQIVLIRKLL